MTTIIVHAPKTYALPFSKLGPEYRDLSYRCPNEAYTRLRNEINTVCKALNDNGALLNVVLSIPQEEMFLNPESTNYDFANDLALHKKKERISDLSKKFAILREIQDEILFTAFVQTTTTPSFANEARKVHNSNIMQAFSQIGALSEFPQKILSICADYVPTPFENVNEHFENYKKH